VAHSIFIASAEGQSGKSTVALGVLEMLSRAVPKVGVFRPVARSTAERDYVLELLLSHATAGIDYEQCLGVTYEDVHSDADAALSRIVQRFHTVEAECDAVVILGSDYTDVGSPTELGFNARIAANLGAPVLLVLGGRAGRAGGERLGQAEPRTADELRQLAELALTELTEHHASLIAVIANRADTVALEGTIRAIRLALLASGAEPEFGDEAAPVWAIPEDEHLVAPSMRSIL
jgi:phosphate acetyltransferase